MQKNFYKHWFSGFENALTKIDSNALNTLFIECGKACSKSYTKEIYIEEYKLSNNMSHFLKRLSNKFPELQIQIKNENTFIFSYDRCMCDLVQDGYVSNNLLCRCSEMSLKENWEAIIGKGNVEVTLLQSILSGDERCALEVSIVGFCNH